MAAMAGAVSQQHLASVAALSGDAQRMSTLVNNSRAATFRVTRTNGIFPLIECAKHAQEKATKHHHKSRPKKRQGSYDKNRKGPTYYPRVGKPPPIWGLDTGEALTAAADTDGNTVVQL